MACKNYQNSS